MNALQLGWQKPLIIWIITSGILLLAMWDETKREEIRVKTGGTEQDELQEDDDDYEDEETE